MTKKDKIAFGLYFIGTLTLLAFGIAYATCSTFMPYHQEAVNMNWEQLSSGVQLLFQALIKIAAAGFFVTGVAALILLFIPFRRREAWAHWAIPLLLPRKAYASIAKESFFVLSKNLD